MKGTPYYDLALDGGYRGCEAEQVAMMIYYQHMEQAQEEEEEYERLLQLEQEEAEDND